MESEGIIGSRHGIYDRFRVPQSLRLHMLRTAAIGGLVCAHWKGPRIRREDVVATMLIHDLGNIVKMDIGTEKGKEILGEEVARLEYWKSVREETIAAYGNDDHLATERMARELGASGRILSILQQKTSANNRRIAESDDWELKICAYADQRTGPFGILSLDERFEDLKRRYAVRGHPLAQGPARDMLVACAFMIERQVLGHTDLAPEGISDMAIAPMLERMRRKEE
jgi:5'-deoxynucleotidase YfbR-like HD superfamily hydrolase